MSASISFKRDSIIIYRSSICLNDKSIHLNHPSIDTFNFSNCHVFLAHFLPSIFFRCFHSDARFLFSSLIVAHSFLADFVIRINPRQCESIRCVVLPYPSLILLLTRSRGENIVGFFFTPQHQPFHFCMKIQPSRSVQFAQTEWFLVWHSC